MTTDLEIRFEEMLDQHRRILFRVASMYATTREDRLDVAQDIRLQLWTAFPSYQPERRFSTWMYRIALNVAISNLRATSLRSKHFAPRDDQTESALANIADPCSEQDSEDQRVLYRLIQSLEPMSRALVMLYLEAYSHAEIADILGISETNVATKINRIKLLLRTQAAALHQPISQESEHGTR